MKNLKSANFNKSKSNNGITLITLVVTIIVLLILAGVSVATLFVDNGLMQKASYAKDQTEISEEKEILDIAVVQTINETRDSNLDETKLKKNIDNNLNSGESEVTNNDDGTFLVIFPSERAYEIDNAGNYTYLENFEKNTSENVVARIKYTYYSTLQNAIEAVPNDNSTKTIILLKDVTEEITIPENKNIILNMNNKAIYNSLFDYAVTVKGNLIINNGIINCSNNTLGSIGSSIKVESTGNLIIDNSLINSTKLVLYNLGNTEIKGNSEINSTSDTYIAIMNSGNLKLTNSKVSGASLYTIRNWRKNRDKWRNNRKHIWKLFYTK